MRVSQNRAWLLGTVALCALGGMASGAMAGGLEVREQSSFFQGTSFAGAAAGGSSLSSVFWNPAASSFVGSGITTDSSYSLILPKTELTADRNAFAISRGLTDHETDIGRDALVPASYAAYRYNDKLVFSVSMNSPFGLGTKPDSSTWAGSYIGTTAKVFSLNVTPTFSYQITPNISVGAGVQVQYVELKKFKVNVPGITSANLTADDIGVGGVAGINITPFRGTSIGLGYRSRIDYDVEGTQETPIGTKVRGIEIPIETPDKVTLSLRQDISPTARLFGTVEWTNWSLLDVSPVKGATSPTVLDFQWEDGWFYSVGGEYDFSNKLTLRAGVAYEESPIQDDTARLVQVPDADRIWASVGATYNWSDTTKLNLAYSHVFVEDSNFSRATSSASPFPRLTGEAESSADIVSVGLTTKLDWLLGSAQ